MADFENSYLSDRISVIIPTKNEEEVLHDCLSSVFNQSLTPFEVIVVDGCSSDDTLEKARHFPVKILIESGSASPANARNIGAEHANGEILLFMDADTLLNDNCLSSAVKYFQDPNVSAVIPFQEATMDTRLEKVQAKWFFGTITRLRTGIGAIAPVQFLRKDVFNKIKFDKSLGYGEDADFHARLQELSREESGRIVYAPDLKISVHFPHTFIELWSQYAWYGRTFMKYFSKHPSIKTTLNLGSLLFPAIFLFVFAFSVVFPELFSVALLAFILLVIKNLIGCYRSKSIYFFDFICFECIRSLFFLNGIIQGLFVKKLGR